MTVVQLMKAIRDEYEQWPALRLTVPQVSRLWNTDEHTSAAALNALVSAGVLSALRGGTYAPAATTAPAAVPRPGGRHTGVDGVSSDPGDARLMRRTRVPFHHAMTDAPERARPGER